MENNKKFDFLKWDEKADDFDGNNSELNSPIHANPDYCNATFYINSFQPGSDIQRLRFELFFQNDTDMTGVIENFFIKVEKKDGTDIHFDLEEVEPEQLYWAGFAMMKIADHYGVNRESIEKDWLEKHREFKPKEDKK